MLRALFALVVFLTLTAWSLLGWLVHRVSTHPALWLVLMALGGGEVAALDLKFLPVLSHISLFSNEIIIKTYSTLVQ